MVIQAVFAAAGALLFVGYEKQHIHWFFIGRILVGLGTGETLEGSVSVLTFGS